MQPFTTGISHSDTAILPTRSRPYPAIWAAVWLLDFDIIVPKQTMFTTDGCQLAVPSSTLG